MVRVNKGLDGVVIDESRVSMVDGDAGEIWYRGYSIDDLARSSTFPETLSLLWNDRLPDAAELEGVTDALATARPLPRSVERAVAELAPRVSPMDTLRSAVSMLAGYVEDPDDVAGDLRPHLLDVVAKVPTVVAARSRARTERTRSTPRSSSTPNTR